MKSIFLYCEKCNKKLIERREDGLFVFKFGKNSESNRVPVEMYIFGSVKMLCIRGTCRHPNVFNYFPDVVSINESGLPKVPTIKDEVAP